MHRTLFISKKFILLLSLSTVVSLMTGCAPKETTESSANTLHIGLNAPDKKNIARQLISAAENSSLKWWEQFAFIHYNVEGNEEENRGYTAGIIGFTSRTHDMLALIEKYAQREPGNSLSQFIPVLKKVDGSPSREGLGTAFEEAWKQAARDPRFQEAQESECDRIYFNPAVSQAIRDGLQELGQFAYFDAIVMHGPGTDANSFDSIRAAALKRAKAPSQGGDETAYLHAFLDARKVAMLRELGHQNTSRVDTMQRNFLNAGNLSLKLPLIFRVNNTSFEIDTTTSARP
jgi:chitosanase